MAEALTKDQALSRLSRTKSMLSGIKQRTERLVVGLGTHFGAIAIAYAVGRLRGWANATGQSLNIPRTPLPIPLTVGVILAVIGASPLVGEATGMVLQAVGTGMATADAALLGFQHQQGAAGNVVFDVQWGGGNGNAGNPAVVGGGAPGQLPDAALPGINLPPAQAA